MAGKLRSHIEKFLQDTPGQRFTHLHHRWKAPAATGEVAWKKVAFICAGLALLLLGFLLSLPPGSPGFLLWFPGLIMLVSRLKAMAILLDRIEMFFRRLVARPER